MDNYSGYGAVFATVGMSSRLRWLYKRSAYPRQSRVFSQAKILIPAGAVTSLVGLVGVLASFVSYQDGRTGLKGIFGASVVELCCLTLLAYGCWWRFGVDEDKVWTKFGSLFHREIYFHKITRFDSLIMCHKLYAGQQVIKIDKRFDYSLLYIRLMEELTRRRFELPEARVEDPNWEEECQRWKNVFMQMVYKSHAKYYELHPAELAKLQKLVQTPPVPKTINTR